MANPLFVFSPLYVVVGLLIAVLVVQEYLRYGLPRRHAVRRNSRQPQHHHHHHRTPQPFRHRAD